MPNGHATCKSGVGSTVTGLIVVCIVAALPALGQGTEAPPLDSVSRALAYDVVSVRVNKSGEGGFALGPRPDGYSAKNVTLGFLIQDAYGVQMSSLISGEPGWAVSTRFDVEARMDAETSSALRKLSSEQQLTLRRVMLRLLLTDRFSLRVQPCKKEISTYALVTVKGGPKLKDADPKNSYSDGIKMPAGLPRTDLITVEDGKMTAQALSISRLADQLGGQLDSLVVDRTGLTGRYDFTLQWAPDRGGSPSPDESRPSLFTALQEQLGLKLESTKDIADGVVITHVERPSEN